MWPFKGKAVAAATAVTAEPIVRKLGKNIRMVRVATLDHPCAYAESPNGLYMIAWADAHQTSEGYFGGFRSEGHGVYALISDNQILHTGRNLERPSFGAVANDGTYIFTDALFGTSSVSMFHVFAASGTEIMQLTLTAKTFSTALSPDGRFAAIQLANSKTEYANSLVFVDIAERCIAWKTNAVGWADSYEFDASGQQLTLRFTGRESVRFTFSGELLAG